MSRTKMALTPELVTRTLRPVPEEGPEPRWTSIPEDELDALVRRVNEESKNEPLWIFAYGSLIRNPDFDFDAREVGTIYGWHRSFSLHIERRRATSGKPGLMLALERSGTCKGIAFRMRQSKQADDLRRSLARKIRYREVASMIRWVENGTDENRAHGMASVDQENWRKLLVSRQTPPVDPPLDPTIRAHRSPMGPEHWP
ncbi:gamma-glutamylcyclotransferase [Rhizobium aethiopicum]|nr:gamma-glutamylcyclotransferase [Rhizobium aethiopicum]